MNYQSIIKRANKAIDKARTKVFASKVHIVSLADDISELSGLIVILSDNSENQENNANQTKS